jgi:hypothetical protein
MLALSPVPVTLVKPPSVDEVFSNSGMSLEKVELGDARSVDPL